MNQWINPQMNEKLNRLLGSAGHFEDVKTIWRYGLLGYILPGYIMPLLLLSVLSLFHYCHEVNNPTNSQPPP